MRFSFLALPVKLISPRRKSRALLGKLMKGLVSSQTRAIGDPAAAL
jgi:hypothetical protein